MATLATDPGAVFDALTAYQRTAAMKAAIELDVFTAIGEGAATVPELARRTGADERGLRALVSRLVVDGFLSCDGNRFALAPAAEMFLDRRSPTYVGSAVTFLTSPQIVEGFNRLTDAVRRGGTAMGKEHALGPEHPVWVEFARAMAPVASITGRLVVNLLAAPPLTRWKVLDVAAGHGMVGIEFLRAHQNSAAVALDWPNVLAVARENAVQAGVADRLRLLPGSAFEVEWGTGYDVVLLPNFLHHFDPAGCQGLLRRAHAALVPGGRVVIVDFIPNEDRVSPPEAAAFSLVMIAGTPAGDTYTFDEYRGMLDATGFHSAALHDLIPSPSRAVLATRF